MKFPFLAALFALLPLGAGGQNIAQSKPITATGAVAQPVVNAVDGSPSTFTHPVTGTVTTGFYYEIDLGQEHALNHLAVINRGDGSTPERLTNYRLALLADNAGAPGGVLWEADVRTDGTNSGVGGTDVVYANASTNPAHVFRGRFVRLTNLSGADANPQVAEVQAWITTSSTNIARGRPVISTGPTWPGLVPTNITDGGRSGTNTISHPASGTPTLGYYYQVDLGAEYTLNRVVLYNRDNCCPDRLSNYRVTVLADNAGAPGVTRWQADIRTDDSNSGLGGADTILASASTNPAHVYRGRFIRVSNLTGYAFSPQIAELEAFPEPVPTVSSFLTDAGNIGGPGLPTSATLSWSVQNADSVSISGIGPVATSGSATVTPASATTYVLNATRAGSTAVSTVTVAVNATELAPRITEFQAADGLLEDEDGDRVDWIELFNPNTFTQVLTNYALTDDASAPAKWIFPLANIPPGGRIVVFASDKNRRVVGAPLHTNFALSAAGEYLAIFSPGASLLQQYPPDFPTTQTFPKQVDRASYGLDGAGALRFFRPATPGLANGAGFDGVVADTDFTVKRGIFAGAQTVAISTATSGATIRYTTNGTEPTETTGTVYSGPLNIAATTVLRAAAFKPGLIPTNVDTNTYIFPADVVTQPTMSTTITQDPVYGPQMVAALTDLPSISIVTPAAIGQPDSVGCSFEYIPVTGSGAQENAGVEHFGGAFTNFQKKNFRVSFNADYGATKLEIPSLFTSHVRGWKPVGKFDQLELRSGSHDMAQRGFYMANIFTDGTMFDLGSFSVHSRFVHLYLNGTYWGMYHLRERWSADHHAAYFGGSDDDHESINGNLNVGGWADPGDAYDGDGLSWQRIKSLRNDYPGVRPYLDVPHYIDYMTMWMFGNAENEYRTTGPKDVGSGFKFFLNDADGFLAVNAWDGNSDNTQRTTPPPGRLNGDGPGSILSALHYAGNADLRILVADRMHRALRGDGPLTPAANASRLTGMCAEIERAFYAESARWVSSGQSRTPASWASARNDILNNWFPTRTATVISQLQAVGYFSTQAAPAFTGGTVASSTTVNFPVAGATVYFTTDGSDPRLPGGAVNPGSFIGNSTVLTKNTFLRARALNGGNWSPLNEAFYTVTTPLQAGDIVFSEIHFNPQGDDDAEFIELLNPTDHAVNLRGAKFTAGLSYDFADNRDIPLAPGGRLVLASSLFAFQKRYGIQVPVCGVYFDRLGNDGDTLTLTTATNAPLFSLNYGDAAPWPDSADGDGYSLILVDVSNPSSSASWRTSTTVGGNPGASDTGTSFTGAPLADADGDGLTALVEHFLSTNDTSPGSGPGAISVGRTADGRATLTFTRRLSADDLSYTVLVSPDLATWAGTAMRTSHINHGNGIATETWTANDPVARQFMQLRVSKP